MLCIKEVKTEHVDVERLRREVDWHKQRVMKDPQVYGGSAMARSLIRLTMSRSTREDLINQVLLTEPYRSLAKDYGPGSFSGVPVDINESLPFGEIVITERVG